METTRTPDTLMDDEETFAVKDLLTVIEALRNVNAAMHRDWAKMNGLLNATAAAWSWCSSYESRIAHYNAQFEVMELLDRHSTGDRVGSTADAFPVTIVPLHQEPGRCRFEVQAGNRPITR